MTRIKDRPSIRSQIAEDPDLREPAEGGREPIEEAIAKENDQLSNFRVAVLATDGVEESELVEPVQALLNAGAHVDIINLTDEPIQAYQHHDKAEKINVTKILEDANPDDYDALVLPGGAMNADRLRMERKAQAFVRIFDRAEKPIAAICHAPWLLVSSGVLKGRRLTSFFTLQDDIRNAGGLWVDEEVVVDGNLVTSRFPRDLQAFNREMLRVFAESRMALAA